MKSLLHRALDLLAMREHSSLELQRKLVNKGFEKNEVEALIATLLEEGLLNDARFAEMFVRFKANAGQGPRRIEMELQQKGVVGSLIGEYLAQQDWQACIEDVWLRKYGETNEVLTQQEKQKRVRFLTQRGFESAAIYAVMRERCKT